MEPGKLRKSIIGSIRYRKPLVLDMMEVDMFEELNEHMDRVESNLFISLISKEIIKVRLRCKSTSRTKSAGNSLQPIG